MDFSILTPSFNAQHWVPCCVESVSDQEGVSVEHLVQDGGSRDGTAEYLRSSSHVSAVVERDAGMYDAVNRAWNRARGEYVGHLNSDEQYLPGTLAEVAQCFRRHPEVDLVIGGTLICGVEGELMAYRKPLRPPLSLLLASHHPVPSCSIFIRRSSFTERQWLYDPKYTIISDALFMIDALRARKRIVLLPSFTSVFFWTGGNLGLCQSDTARREHAYQLSLAPRWLKLISPAVLWGFRLRKMLGGHYRSGPIDYAIYLPGRTEKRVQFHAPRPSGVYRAAQTERVEA